MPDGAPALAMAQLMVSESDTESYHVVDSSTIQTYVTGENPKADLCILPLNLASKLLGTGETYQMLGTVTHGTYPGLLSKSFSDKMKFLGRKWETTLSRRRTRSI